MTRAACLAVALAVAACGSSQSAGSAAVAGASASRAAAMNAAGTLDIASEEVTFVAGGQTVPGTIVRPTAAGRYRAVVLMAGSGPT